MILGLNIAFLELPIIMVIPLIGLITFFASMAGIYIGKKSATKSARKIEILGGLILIGLGIKILIEHLCF